jgi:hypothetical protein
VLLTDFANPPNPGDVRLLTSLMKNTLYTAAVEAESLVRRCPAAG